MYNVLHNWITIWYPLSNHIRCTLTTIIYCHMRKDGNIICLNHHLVKYCKHWFFCLQSDVTIYGNFQSLLSNRSQFGTFGYSATSTTAVGVLIKYHNKNHDNILTPRQTAGVNVHIHPTAPPPIKTRR